MYPCPTCGRAWDGDDFILRDGVLYYKGRKSELHPNQAKLLYFLWRRHRVCGVGLRQDILERVDVTWATTIVYVHEINKWLSRRSMPYYVHCVKGVGYSLRKLEMIECSSAPSSVKPGEPTRKSSEPAS